MKLWDSGVIYKNGKLLAAAEKSIDGVKKTLAYSILQKHNTSGDDAKLKIKFDKITSHDITYVGIIQTARASGLEKFPLPYVLTNCHNSLCAVGGTINEDDHMFGLTCAQKYGGIYVPPHQAVIHQFAREMLAECGAMILGSDSHTRYGALGTMAIGEGGGELAKQLLNKTYDVAYPGVVAIYLTGSPVLGVGPQDVALAIIKAVFDKGYVKNKVMEFIGPGLANLSADFRIGVDVMTTETTCLSSIWCTDGKVEEWYAIHGRPEAYKEMNPKEGAYYDGAIELDLSEIRPMIALPFHPSCAYTIEEVNKFLSEFKVKATIFGIKYRNDRIKNRDAMLSLGISNVIREKIIFSVEALDYSCGPIINTLNDDGDLWVFGKDYKGVELYIKISLGVDGAVCISFHEVETPLSYPFKQKEL